MGLTGDAAGYTARSQVPARAALAQEAHHKDQGGIVTFAGMLAIIAGTVHFIHGLAYVAKDDWGAVNPDALLFGNLALWGWLSVLIGVLQVVVGVGLLTGNWVARLAGVAWAAISAIGGVTLLGTQPFLALVLIALNVTIIRALTDGWSLPDPAAQ